MTTSKPFPVYDPIAAFHARLSAELVAQGVITADRVIYGPAVEMRQEDAPRVWIDLDDDFSVNRPGAGATNTGYGLREEMQDDDGQDVDAEARSLWTVLDAMTITILGEVPEGGDQPAELRGDEPALLARTAVFQLRARVLAACYRILKIGASQIRGKWLRAKDQEWQHGAACMLLLLFATEVPDDPEIIVKPDGEATMKAGLQNGDYTVAVLNLTPTP